MQYGIVVHIDRISHAIYELGWSNNAPYDVARAFCQGIGKGCPLMVTHL